MCVETNGALAFTRLAEEDPDRPVIRYGEQTLTRADVLASSRKDVAVLERSGVGIGDRVVVVRRNAPTHLTMWLACQWLRAVLVPLNFRLAAAEITAIITDCEPRVVVCGATHAIALDELARTRADITWVLIDDDQEDPVPPGLSTLWVARSSYAARGTSSQPAPAAMEDVALMLYTSGTTGRPKGVPLTQGNLHGSWTTLRGTVPTSQGDTALAVAAFGHVGGINTFGLQLLVEGGCIVIQRQFEPGTALEAIERWGVTVLFAVPTMYAALANHPRFLSVDLSSLRACIIGGAQASQELLERCSAAGLPMLVSWGMTECAGGMTMLPTSQWLRRAGSIGQPTPPAQVDVVDPEGRRLGRAGQLGEMVVRGPSVTRGYWRRPESDAKVFLPGGWLRTGDMAMADSDGYLYLVGRAKDLIVSGGENIYPAEIENVLSSHPSVADVAVVGVPDQHWGETPCACVVPVSGASLTLTEVQSHVAASLARYKLPHHLVLLGALPLGNTGKVDRVALCRMARSLTGSADR